MNHRLVGTVDGKVFISHGTTNPNYETVGHLDGKEALYLKHLGKHSFLADDRSSLDIVYICITTDNEFLYTPIVHCESYMLGKAVKLHYRLAKAMACLG